jgi:outer membrane immunogenic protein
VNNVILPQLSSKVPPLLSGAAGKLAGLLAVLILAAGAAQAADLPSKSESPAFQPPPPEFSWTGFYVGVNAGGGVDHFAFPFVITTPGPGGFAESTSGITAGGPTGGIQGGFNYELPFFHLVAGLEADISGTGIQGASTFSGMLLSGTPVIATFGSKLQEFGTARLRLGYAMGNFLPYLAGGFTWATVETFYNVSTPGFFNSGAITQTRSGVIPNVATIGIGAEYAIAPNFTIRAEYLYDFINARRVTFAPFPGDVISFGTRTAYHIGRVGLNYKFDWFSPPPPPVAAKY